jgi:medium-chain acyl-[acyl-carrier-protein] hydrolase
MTAFVRPRPQASPSLRVIAFHHAGGSAAMYYPMGAGLPASWELLILDLPGRGKCHTEPPITSMPALIDRVVDEVRPWLDVPVALFGHSLGAIVAAEAGRACEQIGAPPIWVGVSGRVAPSLQWQTQSLNALDDDALLATLLELGGTPDRIGELPEFRERFLRIVRADLSAVESYDPPPDRARLSCPVTAFTGTSDAWAPPTMMRAWARETSSRFHQRLFTGGHFYFLGPAFAGFTRDIVREIEPCLDARIPLSASPPELRVAGHPSKG